MFRKYSSAYGTDDNLPLLHISIEVRSELCSLGQHCVQDHLNAYLHLQKLKMKSADARDVSIASQAVTSKATIVFTSIFLFEEDDKLAVARELSEMYNARAVVTTSLFCPRHRASCSNPFCSNWQLVRDARVGYRRFHTVFL